MATKTYAQFRTGVDARLKQLENVLNEAEKTEAIEDALDQYSKDRPDTAADDITGDGGFDYLLSGLTNYEDGFSWISDIEYPYDSSDARRNSIEGDRWEEYHNGSAKYLRFLYDTPTTAETIRVHYTIPYEFSAGGAVVIPLTDFRALCNLAAAKALRFIAAKFLHTGESTLSADVVNYRSKSREALDLAKTYTDAYREHMGITEKGGPQGASVVNDWDMEYAVGVDFVTHPKRYR